MQVFACGRDPDVLAAALASWQAAGLDVTVHHQTLNHVVLNPRLLVDSRCAVLLI